MHVHHNNCSLYTRVIGIKILHVHFWIILTQQCRHHSQYTHILTYMFSHTPANIISVLFPVALRGCWSEVKTLLWYTLSTFRNVINKITHNFKDNLRTMRKKDNIFTKEWQRAVLGIVWISISSVVGPHHLQNVTVIDIYIFLDVVTSGRKM